MNPSLEVEAVSRVVEGETYLSEITLRLAPGSMTVLLGRTRAGKTSLLRVLAGLDRPTRGVIRDGGVDVTWRDVRERDVAMVYQQFVNYPSLTVYDNIASPLRLARRLDRAEIDRRVRETAARLRIDGVLARLPAELSGGQQQRTAIARALVKRASLVLLDEPLANLDYKLREELRSELRTLFRDSSARVVYASSEPTEALVLGGTTVVLDEGRILQSGPSLELYRAPGSARVGQITSDPEMTLLDAEVGDSGDVRLASGARFCFSSLLAPGRYRLGVRAHCVRLEPASERDVRVVGNVEVQEVTGSEALLHARVGAEVLLAQLPAASRHALGEPVALFVDPARCFVFDRAGLLVAAPSVRLDHGAH